METQLTPHQIKNIDVILQHSNEYGCYELYGLMVDLWQNEVSPEQLGWVGKYLNPQLETFIHSQKGGEMIYSVYFTDMVKDFNTSFIWPWFKDTYPKFYEYLQTTESEGENPKFCEDHIANYSEFRAGLIEDFSLQNEEDPYFFSFLDEEWHVEYMKNLPTHDKAAATQYLKDTGVELEKYSQDTLDEILKLSNWQKYLSQTL